jgi:hypothetical protein
MKGLLARAPQGGSKAMIKQISKILTRRGILAGLGVGGVAAAAIAAPRLPLGLPPKAAKGSWWTGKGGLEHAALDQWRSQVGTRFTLAGGGGTSVLKLVKVEEMNSKGSRPSSLARDRAFAAVFEAEGTAPSGDAIYRLQHQGGGTLDIFMSAANLAGPKPRLEAVFN